VRRVYVCNASILCIHLFVCTNYDECASISSNSILSAFVESNNSLIDANNDKTINTMLKPKVMLP